MTRVQFLSLFVLTHIFFVFLQIHKHALFIKESYKKQKSEKLLETLHKNKEILEHEFYALKEHSAIKKFAQEQLDMNELRVNRIKKI